MIVPTYLKAINLGPYKKIHIPLDPGIVMVIGSNATDGFDSNGSGKSFLMEIFYWTVSGKSIRGFSADSIVRRGSSGGGYGEVGFVDTANNASLVIRRYREWNQVDPLLGKRGKNSLVITENGELIQAYRGLVTGRDAIEQIFGCSAQSLLSSTLVTGSTVKQFSLATDKVRKQLIESMIEWPVDLDEALIRISEEERSLGIQIASVSSRLYTLGEQLASGDEDTEESVSSLQDSVESLREELRKTGEELTAAREAETRCGDALVAQRSKNDPLVRRYRALSTELATEKSKLSGVLTEGICDRCGGKIDPKSSKRLRDSITKRIAELDRELRVVSREKQSGAEIEVRLQSDLEDAGAIRSRISYAHSELKGRIKETERQLESLVSSKSTKRDEVIASMRISSRELRGAGSRLEYVRFWKQACGPRELRAERVRHLLEEVNTHSINYSGMLSGSGLLAWMEMNPSGGIDIRVRKPDGDFSYEELSAGEQRRVDISFTLALRKASLGLNPDGQAVQVLWLDEVFEAMDRSGMGLVLDVLKELEGEIHGPVVLITHLEYLNSMVDKRIWVSKDEHGRGTARVARM